MKTEDLIKALVEWCSKNGNAESSLLYGSNAQHFVFTFSLFDFLSEKTEIPKEKIAEWFEAAQEKRAKRS